MTPNVFYRVGPYCALVFCGVALVIRYAFERRRYSALPVVSRLFGGNRIWHFSVGALVLAHAVMLLLPVQVQRWNGSAPRLWTAEAVMFVFGVTVLAGLVSLLWRRLQSEEGSVVTELADMAFLTLLSIAALSGLLGAVLYRWGSSWSGSILAPYLESLLRGRPETELVSAMPFTIQIHVLSAFAVLAVLPFTRAAFQVLVRIDRLLRLASTPMRAARRRWTRWLQAVRSRVWIWPEGEEE